MKQNEAIAMKHASEFRQKHGLSSDEPILLESLLLKENVLTLFTPLSDNFSGMALKLGDSKFMLINSKQTIGRQNFSIAHELYHLFVQENFIPSLSSAGALRQVDKEEQSADTFAVHLLLPDSGILSIISDEEIISKKIGIRTILKISSYYQVSWDFTLNRLLTLKIIDHDTYNSAKALKEQLGIKKISELYGGDVTLYKIGRENLVIGEYASYAQQLFASSIISESSYLSMMSEIGVNLY